MKTIHDYFRNSARENAFLKSKWLEIILLFKFKPINYHS
jgi:hypothetical protein